MAGIIEAGMATKTSPTERSIGTYRVLARIGRGGIGEVFLAEDTKLKRKVAIKVLGATSLLDEQARRRFISEAETLAALDHPNICTIHEVGECDGSTFIVMQYIEGQSVASRLEKGLPELSESLDIITQTLQGLAEAHSQGIIHRDIKPQNLMITARGRVKIVDFGLAKTYKVDQVLAEADTQMLVTEPGTVVGTAPYMSPEQARGKTVDSRSDLFSLGAVLYESIAGKSAFSGSTAIDICVQVIHVNPPKPSVFNSLIPRELDRISLKAIEKSLESRYQSAQEMLVDIQRLQSALEGADTETISEAPRLSAALTIPDTKPHVGRSRALLIGILSIILCIATLALFRSQIFRLKKHVPSPQSSYWYAEGVNAIRDGTFYKASLSLREAVQADDQLALAHARLGESLMELDYGAEAISEVLDADASAKKQELPELDKLYLEAITASVRRDFSQAIKSYSHIQDLRSGEAEVYLDLGRAYERNDEIEKAISNYAEASRLAPHLAAAFLRLGVLYGRELDLRQSNSAFDEAERLYTTQSNQEGVAEAFFQRGFILNNINRPREARAAFEHVLTATAPSVYQRIRAKLQLSGILGAEAGQKAANEALEQARDNRMETLYAYGLVDLGNLYFYDGQFDQAEKYFRQALSHAERFRATRSKMRATLSLGSLRISQHKSDEGLVLVREALNFYQQAGYRKEASQGLILIGQGELQLGKYEEALESFKNQLSLAEQVADLSLVASAHNSIGNLLSSKEELPEALRHLEESYRIHKSLDARFELGYDSMQRSDVLWQLGEYEGAKTSLDEATALASEAGGNNSHLLSSIKLVQSKIELSKENYSNAKRRGYEVLALAGGKFADIAIEAKSVVGRAQALSGEKGSGIGMCQAAFEEAEQTGDPLLNSVALLAIAESLLQSGDGKAAFESAMKAQKTCEHIGKKASEWKAWLLAARSRESVNGEPSAKECASHATQILSAVRQEWERAGATKYFARLDVRHSCDYLNHLVSTAR